MPYKEIIIISILMPVVGYAIGMIAALIVNAWRAINLNATGVGVVILAIIGLITVPVITMGIMLALITLKYIND